jgi:dTDP-4-dehydrorhamnose 3,5-epimerase
MFKKGPIKGVQIQTLVKYVDERGFLIETFRLDTFAETLQPQMSYVSYTEPGVARGPHEHKQQTDVFAFIGPGNFKLMIWDNRPESTTHLCSMTIFGGVDNPLLVVVPPGVVHGYRNISKTVRGMVLNYPDKLFRGWGKKDSVDEIRHEDREDDFHRDFQMNNG